jgi:hypothetical protein
VILNTSSKLEVFLRTINIHLCGSNADPKFDATSEVYYFGAGYWRGRLASADVLYVGDAGDGLTLINPDRTAQDIRTIERGLATLLRCEYRDMRLQGETR